MRKMIFAVVAAVALGSSSAAMAAHGGGGGHMGGGFGGAHVGGGFGGHMGGFGGAHLGGGLGVAPGVGHLGGIGHGFAPHVAGVAPGGVVDAAPHTFSGVRHNPFVGHDVAFRGDHDHDFRGDHDHDRFHHRHFGPGFYAYGPDCTYSPYATWPYYNNCYLDDESTYN
jgi:hypothetical protein